MSGAKLAVWLVLGNAVAQSTVAPAPQPTRLERELLAQLDGELCLDALRLLEFLGRMRHVPAIAARLDDERTGVRAAAARTLGVVALHDHTAADAVQAALRRALRDGSRRVQQAAIHVWPIVVGADTSDLEALLADQDVTMRTTAAARLIASGAALHPRDVASLLRDAAGTPAQRHVVHLFAALSTPANAELLRPYLDADEPEMRFRAREALARLEAIAAGAPADWRPGSQRVREAGDALARVARAWAYAQPWREVTRDEVLSHAAASRLVLFGEMHASHGPLRDAQRVVLRVMVAASPGRVVLGFEPSVETAQSDVIDLARELGVEAISLETGWQQRVPENRVWERDDQAASVINARLAADPECRMLVLRGESHTNPGSHLVRQLTVRPTIVLSTACPPFEALGDRVDTLGRTFHIGDGDVWSWSVTDWLGNAPALAGRLSAVDAAPPTRLDRALLALLDEEHRAEALRVLADCGTAANVASVAPLVIADEPAVRQTAVAALGAIASRDPLVAADVQHALQPALRDGDAAVRTAALAAFPDRSGCDWSGLDALLASADPGIRLAAAGKLARCGVGLQPDLFTALLREGVGSGHEALLLPLFDQARTLGGADLLRPYIASSDPKVADRARFVTECLRAQAADERVDWFPDALDDGAEPIAATTAGRRSWIEVAPGDMLREAAGARIVLFGDGARDRDALHAARIAVLRAMTEAAPGKVVLALDATADGGAQLVTAARALGCGVLELERGWRDQRTAGVAGALASRLATDPACRILVPCVASHALSGGWLARQLVAEPCIVRTDTYPPLAALGDRPATAGRTFRRGDSPVFVHVLDDVFADAGLTAWAASWRAGGR